MAALASEPAAVVGTAAAAGPRPRRLPVAAARASMAVVAAARGPAAGGTWSRSH